MSILESVQHSITQEAVQYSEPHDASSIFLQIASSTISQNKHIGEEKSVDTNLETLVSYSRLISCVCMFKGFLIVVCSLMSLFQKSYDTDNILYIIQGLFDITVGMNGFNSTQDRDSFGAFCFAVMLILETISVAGNFVPFFLILSKKICEILKLSTIFLFVLTGIFINAALILMLPVNICAWKFYMLTKNYCTETNTEEINSINPKTCTGP